MNEYRNKLERELKEYYTLCHDNFEPVLRENINEMGLEDLLNLIPLFPNYSSDNKITYCFDRDVLLNIEKKENPITREKFSIKNELRISYHQEGLKGLYDMGPLIGLYEDVPTKVLVPTDKGIPYIVRNITDDTMKKLVGYLFSVDIMFMDETITPLFEISINETNLSVLDDLTSYVDTLWRKGFFFNYWFTAVQKWKNNTDDSFSIIVTDPLLLKAGDSRVDGQKALEYLENEARY